MIAAIFCHPSGKIKYSIILYFASDSTLFFSTDRIYILSLFLDEKSLDGKMVILLKPARAKGNLSVRILLRQLVEQEKERKRESSLFSNTRKYKRQLIIIEEKPSPSLSASRKCFHFFFPRKTFLVQVRSESRARRIAKPRI